MGKREEKYERERIYTVLLLDLHQWELWPFQLHKCLAMLQCGGGGLVVMSSVIPCTHTHTFRPHSQAGGFRGLLTLGMGPGYWERGVDRPDCVGERGSIRMKDRENLIFICLIVVFYLFSIHTLKSSYFFTV